RSRQRSGGPPRRPAAAVPARARGADRGPALRDRAPVAARHLRAHRAAGGRGVTKIPVVAATEFGMLVRTKAFIITVLLMPVLVGGSIVIQTLIAKQVDRTPRKFAVVDRTGALYALLAQGAAVRNALVAAGTVAGAPFEPEAAPAGADADAV